jgi:hypothetical protein
MNTGSSSIPKRSRKAGTISRSLQTLDDTRIPASSKAWREVLETSKRWQRKAGRLWGSAITLRTTSSTLSPWDEPRPKKGCTPTSTRSTSPRTTSE